MNPAWRNLWLVPLLAGLAACQGTRHPPMRTVEHVDLARFMGSWYVIASIPTLIERGAHNAVETYVLAADGTIDTTFTFNKDSFDGPRKVYTPRGFVFDHASNARWGMQFIWPVKADYRIVYLDAGYTQTLIGRQKRDYLWIMARQPAIAEGDYQRMLELARELGYDVSKVRKVPQAGTVAP